MIVIPIFALVTFVLGFLFGRFQAKEEQKERDGEVKVAPTPDERA